MTRSTFVRTAIGVALLAGSIGTAQAGFNDGNGKEWMQLPGTVQLSWNQVAQACPQDGVNACTGPVDGLNLKGWVWATDAQVIQLFSYFEPAILTSTTVEGQAQFFSASSFLSGSAFQPTFSSCQTYFCGASASGWTASLDSTGLPLVGSVSWGNTNVSIGGSFSISAAASADETGPGRGVWL